MSRFIVWLRRGLPWLVLVLGFAWFTHGLSPSGHFDTGSKLPPFKATLVDGSQLALGGSSDQITVLNFWASWCAPCRAEAPTLSRAQAEQHDVRVVGLSVEQELPRDQIAQRARALGMQYRIGVADSELSTRFQLQTLPTTYVIARDGTIVLSRVGEIDHDDLDAALAAARRRSG